MNKTIKSWELFSDVRHASHPVNVVLFVYSNATHTIINIIKYTDVLCLFCLKNNIGIFCNKL